MKLIPSRCFVYLRVRFAEKTALTLGVHRAFFAPPPVGATLSFPSSGVGGPKEPARFRVASLDYDMGTADPHLTVQSDLTLPMSSREQAVQLLEDVLEHWNATEEGLDLIVLDRDRSIELFDPQDASYSPEQIVEDFAFEERL